jgi:hypothetical protein
MNLRDTVKAAMLLHPSINNSVVSVYYHLFTSNGTGYQWNSDGELKAEEG